MTFKGIEDLFEVVFSESEKFELEMKIVNVRHRSVVLIEKNILCSDPEELDEQKNEFIKQYQDPDVLFCLTVKYFSEKLGLDIINTDFLELVKKISKLIGIESREKVVVGELDAF